MLSSLHVPVSRRESTSFKLNGKHRYLYKYCQLVDVTRQTYDSELHLNKNKTNKPVGPERDGTRIKSALLFVTENDRTRLKHTQSICIHTRTHAHK